MNPSKTRINPDRSSGIYVAGEVHAHTRCVDININNVDREKLLKKTATEKRNSTARENLEKAFLWLLQTVMENKYDNRTNSLNRDQPSTNFTNHPPALGYQVVYACRCKKSNRHQRHPLIPSRFLPRHWLLHSFWTNEKLWKIRRSWLWYWRRRSLVMV